MPRPGFYFLICPDSELTRERIEGLSREFPPESASASLMGAPDSWSREAFWGDDGLPPRFWESLTLQDLLGKPRLIVVRQAHALPADDWKKLATALARPNDQAWAVFCLEGDFDQKGNPKIPKHISKHKFWDVANQRGWTWASPGLNPRSIRDHVARWASSRGLSFAPGALEAVSAAMPPDAMAVRRELEKIELAAVDSVILPEHAALSAHSEGLNIFAFISALQSGRAPVRVWEQVFADQGESDGGVFRFLAMLMREARTLWKLAVGENVWVHSNDRAAKTNLARRLGTRGTGRIWDLAVEAELGIKSGRRKPDQAMEMLIAALSELFAGSPQGGAGRM